MIAHFDRIGFAILMHHTHHAAGFLDLADGVIRLGGRACDCDCDGQRDRAAQYR